VNADGKNVLDVNALAQGKAGNAIAVAVDYQTANPASTFNLTLSYESPDNPADNAVERFTDLSMNSKDPRYVEDMVNPGGASRLVSVKRVADNPVLGALGNGTSVSGSLDDVVTLITPTSNQFRVSVNGLPPVTVQVGAGDVTGADANARLDALCAAIQAKVQAKAGDVG